MEGTYETEDDGDMSSTDNEEFCIDEVEKKSVEPVLGMEHVLKMELVLDIKFVLGMELALDMEFMLEMKLLLGMELALEI